ncbi:hypothetical protein [Pseudoxanthomonas sacheonensis]|uniref:Uncharacterized protein n=1 Tax=Pseudoxanthomonas sacheonensis TaxID=443615 RepID=A0ABU1RVT2_9GAMM|nr:hypothetical protein [Pseudoxanthomonas sacheonensis]MDR6842400.1 hypothetical protein [Pseudoxanthomonas sacheonensis]
MRLLAICLLLLPGCDSRWDRAIHHLAGVKEQAIVLADKPFEIDSNGRTFTGKEPMEVLGDMADTCLVLKAKYPMAPQAKMDHDFKALLQGTRISATLTDMSGKKYELDSVGQAWNIFGVVSSSEELSACVSCGCKPKIPVGTKIQSIHVKTDKPLSVLGAYWSSTSAFDDVPEG